MPALIGHFHRCEIVSAHDRKGSEGDASILSAANDNPEGIAPFMCCDLKIAQGPPRFRLGAATQVLMHVQRLRREAWDIGIFGLKGFYLVVCFRHVVPRI